MLKTKSLRLGQRTSPTCPSYVKIVKTLYHKLNKGVLASAENHYP